DGGGGAVAVGPHVAVPPRSDASEAVSFGSTLVQSASAVRTTACAGPVGGVKRTVTRWSVAVAVSPGEASQPRTVISRFSFGAAKGRLVAPSAELNVSEVPGMRLQAAPAGDAGWRRSAQAARIRLWYTLSDIAGSLVRRGADT